MKTLYKSVTKQDISHYKLVLLWLKKCVQFFLQVLNYTSIQNNYSALIGP